MSKYNFLLTALTTWSNSVEYKVQAVALAAAIGGTYVSCPVVTDVGITYYASDPANQPTLGTAPASDDAWLVLGGESTAETLATPLTGFVATSGTPTATSTILQSFNNIVYRTYAEVAGIAVTGIANGVIPFTGSTNASSSNITVTTNTGVIALPLNKIFKVQAFLYVTSAATSGTTLTITSTNSTVLKTNVVSIGADVTSGIVILNAYVQTTGTAAPTVSITASATTGTVSTTAESTITIDAQ